MQSWGWDNMDLIRERGLLNSKGSDTDMGRWIELWTVTAENDNDPLLIKDFDATIVKITGMAAVTDTDSKGFGISFNPISVWNPPSMVRGQVLINTLKPFSITAEVVGNYIIADIPSPKDSGIQSQSIRTTGACLCHANGKITKVSVFSTNGIIAKGSWIKVEKWEQ